MLSDNAQHDGKVQIFVNGKAVVLEKGKVDYDQIVAFAYPNPNFEQNTYKVTYFRRDSQHEGALRARSTITCSIMPARR
jgi:hypothetical protein